MQKKPLRGRGWDLGPLPGFPAKPFETEEEAVAYGAGDPMPCLLCGRHVRKVLAHVRFAHDMDGADYRLRFNIPYHVKLIAPELTEDNRQRGLRPENVEMIRQQGLRKITRIRQPREACRIGRQKWASHIKGVKRAVIYTDFSWHLDQARKVFAYTDVTPPEGHASWRQFKRRRLNDPALNAEFQTARAERPRWSR